MIFGELVFLSLLKYSHVVDKIIVDDKKNFFYK